MMKEGRGRRGRRKREVGWTTMEAAGAKTTEVSATMGKSRSGRVPSRTRLHIMKLTGHAKTIRSSR
jgi:hypothetical protein